MKLWTPWTWKRPSPVIVSHIHVERRTRPSINDETHIALKAAVKGGVEYVPTPMEAGYVPKARG